MWFFRRNDDRGSTRPSSNDPFNLDTPLLMLTRNEAWTIRDALEGTQIFGALGSGKTSGSGAAIRHAMLMAGFGGLVCCAKLDEADEWRKAAWAAGRARDLIIFSPDQPWRFNFLDYERRRAGRGGGMTENILDLLTQVVAIGKGKRESGGEDPFWELSMREMLRNAIDLLVLSGQTITIEALANLIASAPQNEKEIADLDWRTTSSLAQAMTQAESRAMTPLQAHDFEVVARYWLRSHARMADRTRSSVIANFTAIADILSHGAAWELLATETNLVPEVAFDGGIIILDLPTQEYGELGRLIQGIMKYLFQQAVLRRKAAAKPRPVFLWCDEAQEFVSSFDFKYQAAVRSARGATVYLTQNISNYYAVLGAKAKAETDSLLGNFQTKIFHQNTDQPTNQFAAEVIAKAWTSLHGWNSGSQGGPTINENESLQYQVQPGEFARLKKGGPMNGGVVEAIIMQGGRIWSQTGATFGRVAFRQS